MTADCTFIYAPELAAYQLSETHPFKPLRLELTRDLLYATGLLDPSQEVAPQPLDERLLTTIHAADYIRAVKALSQGKTVPEARHYNLGTADNPIFAGMHQATLRVCAATLTALEMVASGQVRRAATLSGGLHHALFSKASGFCLYNDLALAIEAVCKRGARIAYLDIDAHHGDGVQWHFYERSEVMTISLHEAGRYLFPGSGSTSEVGRGAGRGLSVNVPLAPFTGDASFLECFEAVVPAALQVFQPNLIVVQAGADTHAYDPLADLSLSTRGLAACYRRISELANAFCEGRLVVTGGGGYDAFRTVPRAWTSLWAALSGQEVPERLPQVWLEAWQARSPMKLPATFHDALEAWPAAPEQDEIRSHNQATVRRLLDTLEPIWQERFGPQSV